MELDTTELINRCKAGERHALDLLYQQYKPKLLNICKQYAKEDDVAEDLLHDAFVVILTSLDKLEKPEKLESWMISIVRNVGYHYRQHANKEQSALMQLAKEETETTDTSQTPSYDQLQSFVALLPQGYQDVFRLSVFENFSHQEISKVLGIAPHSSSSQLFHAKRTLRTLIRRSWVLLLLLIAVPTAIWLFIQKDKTIEESNPIAQKKTEMTQEPERSLDSDISQSPILVPSYQTTYPKLSAQHKPSVEVSDTTTYQIAEAPHESIQETTHQTPIDTTKVESHHDIFTIPAFESGHLLVAQAEVSRPWHISMTYSGIAGNNEDYMAQASVGKTSFNAISNTSIPTQFNNWIDYALYLNYDPMVVRDAETRSINYIATLNSTLNGGMMEAHHKHQLPVTFQILLNRQLTKRLSVETGLSYTQLNSTITTGSTQAFIQEKQQLRYLGIPLRLGWQWYSKAHFSLYSSVGATLELPVQGKVLIRHEANGSKTFQKKTDLDVPYQWSTTFGLGLQYNLTPHLGLYLEPCLQYFFNDGSDIQSYRTEHPLQITLPLGIRVHW